jgi:putative ABC transport system permease protein
VKNPDNNTLFQEANFYFADSVFFEVFDFRFLMGDKATALRQPNSLVLTRATARRYFGDGDPLGKTLAVEGKDQLTVTGVIEDLPSYSTLRFELLAPVSSARKVLDFDFDNIQRGAWYYPAVHTFVKFPDHSAAQAMQRGMADFEQTHLPKRLKERYDFQLQPLAQMHFTSLEGDLQPAVKISFLNVLLGVALLILGIACANYVNLALSRVLRRLREIGTRRVLGAGRRQIFQQMSVESVLFLGLSFLLALGVVQMGLPAFNRVVDKQLSFRDITPTLWVSAALGALAISLVISLLPYLTVYKPGLVRMLKNEIIQPGSRRWRGVSFKNTFVVFQFSGAVALLVVTLIVLRQLDYLKGKDLGLQTEQVVVVPIRDESLQNNFAAVKEKFGTVPGIKAVSAISNFPWEKGYYDFPSALSGQGKNVETNFKTLLVDKDFVETMGMKMQSGRSFAQKSDKDTNSVFLLNEAAARQFGVEEIQNLRLAMKGVASGETRQGEVLGIVRDFHLQSLHHAVEPLAITIAPEAYYLDNFVFKLQTEDLPATLAALSGEWSKWEQNHPFEYFFLDDTFDKLYRRESRMGTLFVWFSLLALFIACLGMFALSAVLCEQRTKEIGIRKVLGASVAGITGLLTKDFLKLVAIAILVASPLAYFFMQKWLADFAYRIDIHWWMFAAAGATAVAVAFLTVSFQSVKAALANPVKSLRSE